MGLDNYPVYKNKLHLPQDAIDEFRNANITLSGFDPANNSFGFRGKIYAILVHQISALSLYCKLNKEMIKDLYEGLVAFKNENFKNETDVEKILNIFDYYDVKNWENPDDEDAKFRLKDIDSLIMFSKICMKYDLDIEESH